MHTRHMVWARVTTDREQLLPLAPEGYEPIVEVFLHGRADAVIPAYVETRDDRWIRIQATTDKPGEAEGKWHHADSLLHVPEDAIARIEIRFRKVRPDGPVGFSHSVVEE